MARGVLRGGARQQHVMMLWMIDNVTGRVLFGGQGHLAGLTSDDLEGSARVIGCRMLTLFGGRPGWLGSGDIESIGSSREAGGRQWYLVKEWRCACLLQREGSGSEIAGWP